MACHVIHLKPFHPCVSRLPEGPQVECLEVHANDTRVEERSQVHPSLPGSWCWQPQGSPQSFLSLSRLCTA